jgi:hypothetical protein
MDTAVFLLPKTDRAALPSAEDRGGVYLESGKGRARLVVADGAGTTHLSGLFAELIVESFIDDPPFGPGDNAGYQDWLERMSAAWHEAAAEKTGSQWYARENLARGSAAAFAAAVVVGDACWCAAVGDCCLFQIRNDPAPTCVASFPLNSGQQFNSSPPLLTTDPRTSIIWPTWSWLDVERGDVLIGVSDGIGEWILGGAPDNPEIWGLLTELNADGFRNLIDGERERGTMVDDDTVLVRLVIGDQ